MARPQGFVAGDVIAQLDDPNRGKWLNVWGSAYSYPVLHATREAAAAVTQLRGACVAHVTEYPMPGGGLGQCYRITPGTLTNRADPALPPGDYDGRPIETAAPAPELPTVHRHAGPNSHEVSHNHAHGNVRHDHGTMRGFTADRWQWIPATTAETR